MQHRIILSTNVLLAIASTKAKARRREKLKNGSNDLRFISSCFVNAYGDLIEKETGVLCN